MYNNYDYPIGADYPDAPWNEKPVPKRSFDVFISQTLSKSTQVVTDDYVLEDDDIHADTSDTEWANAYSEEHYTPLELIEAFKDFLQKHLPDPITNLREYKKVKKLIAECENWVEDDLEIMED